MAEQNKTYSQMKREFYEKYKKEIVPTVKKYDNERKTKLVIAIICATLGIIVGIALVYIAAMHGGIFNKSNEGVIKLAILSCVFAYFIWYVIKKDFENKIKEKIMPSVCKCFGDMKWSNGSYSDGKLFSSACVIPAFTSEEYDDIFRGSYKDVKIEIVEPEYDQGYGKHRHTVFNGVIIKLSMNKAFTSHTLILPNGLIHGSTYSKLNFTELEDVEFNKKYAVFTNDEIDARYLITPAFMERLKNIKIAFKSNKITCAFYGKHLIIALQTKQDLFSICSLVKPIDDKEQYIQMYEEIVSIIKLIDHFKLNEKTGL